MKIEESRWKVITGYPDYRANEKGEILSMMICDKPRILKGCDNSVGYKMVNLYTKKDKNGERKMKTLYVHRIIASMFIENPDNLETVNHENGLKEDNRSSNLTWMSRSQNQKHAFKTGLMTPMQGEKHWNAKFTDIQATTIIELYNKGMRNKELCALFNTRPDNIYRITSGKTWRHLHKK